jgi:superfamily I DNA and/or RNA helicase
MNNYEDWDDNSSFPFVSKAKFTAFTKILKGSHLKMVSNWGVNTLNRQQQLQAMELQLKMHNSELNEFKQGTNIHQGNLEWKEAEKAIIHDANIVCCTLSMAGSNKLDTFRDKFEYLIIDEACQSTEPSTMIPMQHAPKRVILVGDQKQLPATTFSGNSEQTGYCKSLFERLLDAGFDKTMLTI